jgi:hypothetical protein
MKIIKFIITFIICTFVLNIQIYAHPGRTDSEGGHNDNINGGYHYHHGEPAHQHYDGVCPYDVDEPPSSSSSLDDEDRVFYARVSYAVLGFILLGIGNRIRWEIKERVKNKKLSYKEKGIKIFREKQ